MQRQLRALAQRSTVQQGRIARERRLSANSEMFPRSGGGGFPWDKMVNGFVVNGANVTLIEPEIQFSDAAPVSIANQAITITSDYQYVGIQYNFGTKMLSAWGPNLAKPTNDDDYLRRWLFQFRLVGGVASMFRINGGLYVPAVYGDAA